MCSDGLIAHLSDSEILQVVLAKDDPQAVCEVLVDVANKRGGVDNTTVLVVRYEK